MNSLVGARVPLEIRDQGNAILKQLGSSPTELVNKACEYVIRHGILPGEGESAAAETEPERVATAELIAQLKSSYEAMSVPMADPWEGKSFKQIRDELEEDRYARFA